MSHSVRRKSAVRSLEAIRAGMAAFGIAEGDQYGTTLTVSEDGNTVTLATKRFTGAYAFERPVPVVFDLKTGNVDYDHDFTAAVSEFLARIVAEQIKQKARREGHSVTAREVIVKGRRVLRVSVEG